MRKRAGSPVTTVPYCLNNSRVILRDTIVVAENLAGWRCPDRANADRAEDGLHRRAPVRISITQQNTPVAQDRIGLSEETARNLDRQTWWSTFFRAPCIRV